MVGHTRRFNPSHQYVKQQIDAGEFNIQAMDIETYFFRRKNMNAKGQPRSWTDHLLWHHSAHSIDIFQYMTGSKVIRSEEHTSELQSLMRISNAVFCLQKK